MCAISLAVTVLCVQSLAVTVLCVQSLAVTVLCSRDRYYTSWGASKCPTTGAWKTFV